MKDYDFDGDEVLAMVIGLNENSVKVELLNGLRIAVPREDVRKHCAGV